MTTPTNNDKQETTELDTTKWGNMTLQQLNAERDKVVNKMSLLHGMMGYNANISIYGIYKALEHALISLDELITYRTQQL